jgi:pimeloyl-ACP methyl ester carboxylesterase
METWVPHLDRHLVLGSGHWTQQEKPDEVTGVIADWMAKTFGVR